MKEHSIAVIRYNSHSREPIVTFVKNDVESLCNELQATLANLKLTDTDFSILMDAYAQDGSKPYNLTIGSKRIYGDFMLVKDRDNEYISIEYDEIFKVINWFGQLAYIEEI
ncbi:hypothetical protein V7103_19655 [Neobacillus drentensis]|jgi:hypothetical protein|uniref:hypothetical protein n=1 Tax=Neobacillus drentensis TaxID=220684 RepID=UPI002FFEDA28